MLHLQSIKVFQYRNHANNYLQFHQPISVLTGSNGVGKTNLLEAVYYLSFTKNYGNRTDVQNTMYGAMGWRVDGVYTMPKQEQVQVSCIFRENGKKQFFFDGEEYKKMSAHVGKIPCVMIAPDDVKMITEASDERRKYIDQLLCQTNAQYLQQLMAYNKILQQKQGLLKQAEGNEKAINESLWQVINEQLLQAANLLYEERKKLMLQLQPLIMQYYHSISGYADEVAIAYQSQLQHSNMATLLQQYKAKEIASQRCLIGIHKDDLFFTLNQQPFKLEASQGQRKTLLFALKLAEWDFIKQCLHIHPILLLDDIFEKLDEHRIQYLLQLVSTQSLGHILITDTHQQRVVQHLQSIAKPFDCINL